MTSPRPALDDSRHDSRHDPLRDSLRDERDYHDACRTALAAMVDGAAERVVTGEDVSASGADAEVLGYQLRSRAKALTELPEGPLFFGRLDVDVPAARSMRRDGELRIRHTDDVLGETVAAVRDALTGEGSVGVVAADAEAARVREALTAAGIGAADPDELGARVAVVPASLARGLEYDHVVAVEPAAVAEAEERGLHRLYVVLTRAVSRLDVVHGRPLPF